MAVTVVVALSGCTSPHRVVTSALSAGPRACVGSVGHCSQPGVLRWSLPLPGRFRVSTDAAGGRMLRPALTSQDGDALSVTADRATVYLLSDTTVVAVDAATGMVRWRHTSRANSVRDVPVRVSGGRVLVLQRRPHRYLSLDRRTGQARTIPLGRGERPIDPDEPGADRADPGPVLLDSDRPHIRRIDPTSGRTVWQAKLDDFSAADDYAVHDGILYLDEWNVAKTGIQGRALQRVDLQSGRRLADIPLPRASWRPALELAYITTTGVVVLTDGSISRAFTLTGEPVSRVPRNDSRVTHRSPVRLVGKAATTQHLVGHGWTGPAMRVADPQTVRMVDSAPRVVVAVACAPDGVRDATFEDPYPAQFCDKPRLFAVTW